VENVTILPGTDNEVRISVGADEPSQPYALVQQLELCPEVDQTIARGCSGEPHDALYHGPSFHQGPEALGTVVLERGELVDDHHVEVEGQGGFLDQPLHILAVDDVQISLAL